MARNPAAAYGLTLSCMDDVDALFSTVDGIEGIAQDMYHRLTNATVLGPGGEEWGEDLTRWPGMPADKMARRGPYLAEVITRDERIDSADVDVVPSRIAGTRWAGTVQIVAHTALGPFRRVFGFDSKTVADITNILEGEA